MRFPPGALLLAGALLAAPLLACAPEKTEPPAVRPPAAAPEQPGPQRTDAGGEPRELPAGRVDGQQAMEHVRALLRFGGRTPGSEGHRWAEDYIIRHLRLAYAEVEEASFAAQTPDGVVAMKNIVGKIPGGSPEIVLLAGHYDTLDREGFLGANDGGSSAALLLELARVLGRQQPLPLTVWVVFFDGEEAVRQWGPRDGTYGSRYQAGAWQRAGVLERVKAMILVDMIGDKDLTLRRDLNSTPWLTGLVWQIAREKGYGEHFLEETTAIEDDHLPFVRAGVAAVDLIDFDYGPGNRYWHSRQDTLDKLGARSFEIVGEVVLETVARLGQRWPGQPTQTAPARRER